MSKHTPEERKAMKVFLDEVEMRLNQRQDLFHNAIDWRPEYGPQKVWDEARDAEHTHLIKEWELLRQIRKDWGIK